MPPTRRNGVTALPPTQQTAAYVEREPLRTTAETIPYKVTGPDGETVTLAGYKRAGCPLDISIAWDEASAEYGDEYPTPEDANTLSQRVYNARYLRADRLLRRAYLQAVIPGLREAGYENAVNVLAGDDGQYAEILTELGWWARREEAADDSPEAVAGDQTGPDESPAGSQPITSTPSAESPVTA